MPTDHTYTDSMEIVIVKHGIFSHKTCQVLLQYDILLHILSHYCINCLQKPVKENGLQNYNCQSFELNSPAMDKCIKTLLESIWELPIDVLSYSRLN